MVALADDFPNLSIFAGADPLILPLLGKGGAGCITATANLAAAALRTIFDGHADAAGQSAVDRAQRQVVGMRTVSSLFPQIPTIKAMIARRYGDDGWAKLRLPLVALAAKQRWVVAEALDNLER